MVTMVAVGAAFTLAGAASAQFTVSATAPGSVAGGGTGALEGASTVDSALTGFSSAGGAFLGGPLNHTVGTTQAMGGAVNPNFSTTVIDNGNGTRTLEARWFTNTPGTALFGPGATIGGAIITDIGFELGEGNAGTDIFNFPGMGAIKHPDTNLDGVLEAAFTLLDANGASIFSGTYFVTPGVGGFSGVVFINAGGADLGTFNIGGGLARVTFNVTAIPTPGALALFGVAGLVGARRRR